MEQRPERVSVMLERATDTIEFLPVVLEKCYPFWPHGNHMPVFFKTYISPALRMSLFIFLEKKMPFMGVHVRLDLITCVECRSR